MRLLRLDLQQSPLRVTRGVDRVLRVEKPARRNEPRSIVRIHIADEHEVLRGQVAQDGREVAVSPTEQRRAKEIDDDAAARIIAFRYLGPESLKRQVAKLFDRLARFTLKKSSLFVERQSERQKSEYLQRVRPVQYCSGIGRDASERITSAMLVGPQTD